MSDIIDKRYWKHIIIQKFGTLEECIEFMNNNKPKDNTQWYELKPYYIHVNTCTEYLCNLVEIKEIKIHG